MIGRIALLAGLISSAGLGGVRGQDAWSAPPLLHNRSTIPGVVEFDLTAAPARLALVPGTLTDVYAYNGSIPGPTLELREGDRVTIHFHNDLPEATTVHWHGLNVPVSADGSPYDPVAPGASRDYVFTVGAGTAGTYWYHPHPDHRSGFQIAKGLFGAIIIRAADDPLAGVPEKLLILSDNRFRADGSLDLPDPDSPQGQIDMENGREGDVLFVNGHVLPTIPIQSGAVQRWRVINASAARVYRLALAGQTILHVGDDGGLFERPDEVKEILLANSERVELLVRGDGQPGSRTTLQALPYDRYVPQTRPAGWNQTRDLLTLAYSADRPRPPLVLPPTLRVIPALDTADATVTRVVVLSQGLINGKAMDMNRVDFEGRLGTTEIWEIDNVVGMDHPFHLHGFHFQVLDRNGVPAPRRSWKDSVNVPAHETVRIIVRFDGYPGKWMFHCHILDHEDQGMMGVLELK
ncbi:MAG TPA: multicopper oxidase family protein [Gemmatimonadales bacterium]|nr:multicopper oxidase family protein [Gemmatimonadales bacterium]